MAGIANTIITYIIYFILLQFFLYSTAYSIAFVSGIILSYALNTYWVFHQTWSWKKLVQYPMVYFTQYFSGLILLMFFVEYLLINPKFAALLNIVILLPITFFLTRWIIKDKQI